MIQGHRAFASTCAWSVLVGLALGCTPQKRGLEDDVVAVVAGTTITSHEVEAQRGFLGTYAEQSLGDDAASRAILTRAIVETSILAHAGELAGLRADPRFGFSLREAEAALQVRRVVGERMEADPVLDEEAALAAWLEAHRDEYEAQPRRSMELVVVPSAKEGERIIAALRAEPELDLADFGEVQRTKLEPRDDESFPLLHPLLFHKDLGEGGVLPVVSVVNERLIVGRVLKIEPAAPVSLDDPFIRAEVAERWRAEREAQVLDAYLKTLDGAAGVAALGDATDP